MAMVTVRYWAAAKQAAGVAEEDVAAGTLAEALAVVAGRPGADELRAVLARSSFLVDGEQVRGEAARGDALRDGSVIEVLPPFAGG